MTNKVSQVEVGDSLTLENGKKVSVLSITNGMYFGSKTLTYSNGDWSCLLNNDIINVNE